MVHNVLPFVSPLIDTSVMKVAGGYAIRITIVHQSARLSVLQQSNIPAPQMVKDAAEGTTITFQTVQLFACQEMTVRGTTPVVKMEESGAFLATMDPGVLSSVSPKWVSLTATTVQEKDYVQRATMVHCATSSVRAEMTVWVTTSAARMEAKSA